MSDTQKAFIFHSKNGEELDEARESIRKAHEETEDSSGYIADAMKELKALEEQLDFESASYEALEAYRMKIAANLAEAGEAIDRAKGELSQAEQDIDGAENE